MRLIELLVSWTEAHPEKAGFVVGPSTTKALAAIRSGSPIERAGIFGTTNGAAMKVSPIGVAYDYRHMEELVDAVEELARPTHNTGVAIACAAAVAAAVSYGARGGSDLDELWEIALDAAREGETRGYALPTARMSERLSEVHERVASESMPESLRLLRELYGCGVESIETGPAAVAIASLSEGDPWRAACMAAGIGGDTDTLGAIACAICGAMHPEKLPVDKIALIEQVNNLCLRDAAEKLAALAR